MGFGQIHCQLLGIIIFGAHEPAHAAAPTAAPATERPASAERTRRIGRSAEATHFETAIDDIVAHEATDADALSNDEARALLTPLCRDGCHGRR